MTSSSSFDPAGVFNLIGLWDFSRGAETKDTGLADGIAQNGHFHGNAHASGGKAVFDGNCDWFDVSGKDAPFDLSSGTIEVQFEQAAHVGTSPDTLVNRGEWCDRGSEGYFGIQVLKTGALQVIHCANGKDGVLTTDAGLFKPCDEVKVTYSWDAATGAKLVVENMTTGASQTLSHSVAGLDMDIGDNDDENFTFGAREADDGDYDQFFNGAIDYVAIYEKPAPEGDGVVEGTAGDDLIDIAYTGDPEGDRIDNGDALLPGAGPDDDVVDAGAGNDTVLSGAGNDTVYAGSGNDTVDGGAGNDVIYGDSNLNPRSADSFGKHAQDISNVVYYYDRDGDGVIDYSVKVENFPSSGSSKFISNDLDDYYNQLNSFIVGTDPNLDATTTVVGVSVKGGIQPTVFYRVDGNTNGPATDPGPTTNTGPGNNLVLQYPDFHATYDPSNDGIVDTGAPGDDTLSGGAGNDTIYGEGGNDTISGGDGNDHIFGGAGSDNVDGGDGDDFIDTSGPLGSALPDRGFPSYNGFPAVPADADPFNDRDTVYGGAGNDTIITGDDEDYIDGGSGNDVIDGGLDDDTILGGDGEDYIIGGEGSDIIDGGADNDIIYGGLGPVLPDALNIRDDGSLGPADPVTDNGKDVIHGGDGSDRIFGQDDDDILYGDAGEDYLDGGIDDDTLYGGDDFDTLIGGQGNDLLDGGSGNDMMFGGDDRDTFVNVNAGDTVHGGEGFSLDPSDDFDTLDLTGSAVGGSLKVNISGPDSDGNGFDGTVDYFDALGNLAGTLTFTNIESIVPCFTPGTMIATPRGQCAVETLKAGDRIITRDNGIQRIRWIGQRTLRGAELARNSHLHPVRIRKGALGNGLPERDMLVSPNHRMLVASDKTALYFEESEVLVAAKHLTGLAGVEVVPVDEITYIHFMFDQHEVVLSDGTWTESFQPGDQSLMGLGNAQRNEIYELFPELKTRSGLAAYQSARRSLKRHEAQLLVH